MTPPRRGFIFCFHSSPWQAMGYSGQKIKNGPMGIRTPDPRLAKAVLYQLSYRPVYMSLDMLAENRQNLNPSSRDVIPHLARGGIEMRESYSFPRMPSISYCGVLDRGLTKSKMSFFLPKKFRYQSSASLKVGSRYLSVP